MKAKIIKNKGIAVIDQEGFRRNVGIIVTNGHGKVLWARRFGSKNAWQFPQGGVAVDETALDAMYRELNEELGLSPDDVLVLAESSDWYRYRLPNRFQRRDDPDRCVGQKQKWFLLELKSADSSIRLDACSHPEFDAWRWVSYWYPLKQVIFFKRAVYRRVLREFSSCCNH